jgi:hypothetical protein
MRGIAAGLDWPGPERFLPSIEYFEEAEKTTKTRGYKKN